MSGRGAGGNAGGRPMNQPNPLTEEALLLKSQLVAETRTAVEAEINARLREIIAGSTETITEELLKHLEVSLKSLIHSHFRKLIFSLSCSFCVA
jgi:hypothetical protein